ncbi:hypothetical protein [Acidaminobacterium chupaoyuni]
MVKGVSKRAVVVRPQDSKLFEQAIFIVAEQTAPPMTKREMLSEATRLASGCASKNASVRNFRSHWLFFAGMGATGILWLLSVLLF